MPDNTKTCSEFPCFVREFYLQQWINLQKGPVTGWRKVYPGAMRRVNALADCNQWQQHDLQNFPGCQTARVSGRGFPRWRGCWYDGDAGVLVTLVVPGRPCRVCAEIKQDVLGQPQATCPCGTCCWLGLCSLCKNSCFPKWNESKAKGGKQKPQLRMKGKHRPNSERIPAR